jgi:hypothetical protein
MKGTLSLMRKCAVSINKVPPRTRAIYLVAADIALLRPDYFHCGIDKGRVKALSCETQL